MHNKRKTILGLVVSALFLVLIFYNVDFKELIATFMQFESKNLWGLVTVFAFSLLIRAFRWKYLLCSDKRFSIYRLTSAWVIGNLMNAFLPARAGDIWRAYEIGTSSNESKMKIFGSVMLERILDGVCICVILYFCILSYANLVWIRRTADISMLLFGGSLVAVYLIVKFNKIGKICDMLVSFAESLPLKIRAFSVLWVKKLCHQMILFVSGFEVLKSSYFALQGVVLSFAIWILEFLITFWVIKSFGIHCPISAAMFVVCFVALGSMIPSSSIFVGPYQYAYILALGVYFVPKSEALAVAVVQQAILMGSLLVFSGIFALINLFLRMKRELPTDKEKNVSVELKSI